MGNTDGNHQHPRRPHRPMGSMRGQYSPSCWRKPLDRRWLRWWRWGRRRRKQWRWGRRSRAPTRRSHRRSWGARGRQTLWTTPGCVHQRPNQNQGVSHAVGTLLQSQPSIYCDGSTLLPMNALSHLLQRTTHGDMDINHKPCHFDSGKKTQCHHP